MKKINPRLLLLVLALVLWGTSYAIFTRSDAPAMQLAALGCFMTSFWGFARFLAGK